MTSTMHTTISMREEDWASLVYSVERGNCILMLGPEAVMVRFEGKEVPVLIGLAEFVRDKLGPEYAYLDPMKPAAIAQAAVHQEDSAILQAWVKEFHELTERTSTVFEDLAALPFRLVINTSPVLDIEQAFLDVKPDTAIDFYDRTGPSRPNLQDPTPDAPLIYNLFGSLNRPDSLILSDDDRLEFLVSVITDTPKVPPTVTAALRNPKQSFLFLGFSLHQWRLRLLLHVLASAGRRSRKSFAIELERSKLDPETCMFYERGQRIGFLDMGLGQFTEELKHRVALESAEGADQADEPAPHAPVAFLCHASEDKDIAQHLAAELKANGIRPWLDNDELKGGEQWDRSIRRTIKQVDYVVVIQSRSLLEKDVGYVNREITLALDRQHEFRDPRRFVIPITVHGPDVMLDDLRELQSIDYSSDSGVDEVVRAINRDVELARRTK